MRTLTLLLLLSSASAAASAPTRPTLGTPKEDEERPTPRPGRAAVSQTEADVALVRALLWAVEPAPVEIRTQAVEDLALLGDARALNLLAQLVFDTNPTVQLTAVRTVTRFQHPRAEEILANILRHPNLPELLKSRAMDGLLLQRSPGAREALEAAAQNPRHSRHVVMRARSALSAWTAQAGARR